MPTASFRWTLPGIPCASTRRLCLLSALRRLVGFGYFSHHAQDAPSNCWQNVGEIALVRTSKLIQRTQPFARHVFGASDRAGATTIPWRSISHKIFGRNTNKMPISDMPVIQRLAIGMHLAPLSGWEQRLDYYPQFIINQFAYHIAPPR